MLHRTVNLYRNAFGGLSKDIWLLAFVTFVNRSGTMVVPFLTVYLTTKLQFSLTQAGWVMTCFGVGSVLGTLLGGKLTDKIGYYILVAGAEWYCIYYLANHAQFCSNVRIYLRAGGRSGCFSPGKSRFYRGV